MVLEAIGDVSDAIAEIDFSAQADLYFQVKVAFPSAALIAARPANENYGPNFAQAKNAIIPDGWGANIDPVNATDINFAPAYSVAPAHFGGTLVAGTYYTFDFRITTNGSDQQTWYTKLNGTFIVNGAFNAIARGQVVGCQFGQIFSNTDSDQIVYIDNIKIGTSGYGSTDIFSEDFEGATPLANFTSTTGTLNIVSDPFAGGIDYVDSETLRLALVPSGIDIPSFDGGIESLKLAPSGTETYGHSDVGTELFKFTPSSDEHYCPQKVEFEGFLESRWSAEKFNRWVASSESRWSAQFLGVGEGFAC